MADEIAKAVQAQEDYERLVSWTRRNQVSAIVQTIYDGNRPTCQSLVVVNGAGVPCEQIGVAEALRAALKSKDVQQLLIAKVVEHLREEAIAKAEAALSPALKVISALGGDASLSFPKLKPAE